MAWQGIEGHDTVVQRFQKAFARGRLAGSFLFVGPSGIGKRRFALALARTLLCKGHSQDVAASMTPCGHCESCKLFAAADAAQHTQQTALSPNEAEPNEEFISPHPDLFFVCKPPDKSDLPLELLIGAKERRGREGLCYDISRTPYLGHRKVAILDDADFLNVQGANALLKTLEEPPPDSVLILIATSAANLLPTIRSRCQSIRFLPLSPRTLASVLVERQLVPSLEQGLRLAQRADGSLERIHELLNEELEADREEMRKGLSHKDMNTAAFSASILGMVEKAGKEAPPRRRQLRLLLGVAIDFYRENLKKPEQHDEAHSADLRSTMRCLERTLDALQQIDANANLNFLVESWCADMKMMKQQTCSPKK